MATKLISALLMVTVATGVCAMIALGVETILDLVWRRKFRAKAPLDWLSILSYLAALLIAIWGVWIVPQFQVLFESFGADLPWPARVVMQYRYLLALPLGALALLHFSLRRPGARLPYIFHVLTAEFVLSVLVVMSMSLPVFSVGEPIQG